MSGVLFCVLASELGVLAISPAESLRRTHEKVRNRLLLSSFFSFVRKERSKKSTPAVRELAKISVRKLKAINSHASRNNKPIKMDLTDSQTYKQHKVYAQTVLLF